MNTKNRATVEDLYHLPEDGKAELVDGELVPMSPTGGLPGYAAFEIGVSLRDYGRKTRSGHAVGDNVGFLVDLPNRQSFSPDAAFYTGDITMKFLTGAPIFAVEVRSENDYGPSAERAMARKWAEYFTAGTLVVWDVDLLSADVVRVYRIDAPTEPTIYWQGDLAEAEPALPGWSMPVAAMFPYAD